MASSLSIEIGSHSIRAAISKNGKVTQVPLGFSSSPYSCPAVAARISDDNYIFGDYAMNWLYCSPGNFYHINDIEPGSQLLDKLYESLFRFVIGKVKKIDDTPLTSCTIIVPAYYASADPRKNRLYEAAIRSGFNVVNFQSDAVAVCMKAASVQDGETVLIFDFGYSGLTISVLRRQNNALKTLSSIRNSDIGGRHIDALILEDIERCIDDYTGTETLLMMSSLARCAERIKEELTDSDTSTQSVIRNIYTIDRKRFTNMVATLFSSALQSCKTVIEQAGLKYTDISKLLLCGGCSNIPFVREFLHKSFIANDNGTVQIYNLANLHDYKYLACYGAVFSSYSSTLIF